MQDLDQGLFQPRNLKPVLDPPDEPNWADLDTNVFQQAPDERCVHHLSVVKEPEKSSVRTWAGLGILQQIFPEVVVALLLCKIDCAVHVAQPLDD